MENQRKFKKTKQNKPASVDGFFASSRGYKGTLPVRRVDQNTRARLDDFRPRETRFSESGTMKPFGRQPKRDDNGQIAIELEKKQSKHQKRKKGSFRKITSRAMTTFLVTGLVLGGYFFGSVYIKALQVFQGGGAAALEENITKDGRINILLLGRGGAGHTAPDLTDTIVLASIDPVNNEAALVSIPRDFYVRSGPYGGYTKINAVYSNAKNQSLSGGDNSKKAEEVGLQAIRDEISKVTGVPIHYHVMVDFRGFEKAIDVVGGITINVPPELAVYDAFDGSYILNVKAGAQTFDGERALAFSRSRKTSMRGDFDRSERQRLMLLGLRDKVFTLGTYANPIKVTQLLNTLGSHVRTNLSGLDELGRLYEISGGISSDKVESIGLADASNPILRTDNIGGLSVVVPRLGLDNYDEIHKFLQKKLRDGFLKSEDAKIAIYNSTGIAGLAARTAKDLRTAGYTVGEVRTAATTGQAETVIVDLSNGVNKYTREYLEKRFDTKVVSSVPAGITITPGDAEFVIILGQNEQTRLAN